MKSRRPPLFRKRQFEPVIIVTCVRWYLRFPLSTRDVEALIAERGVSVDHTTIWRWMQRYGPELYRQMHGQVKRKSSTWHMDETFVRVGGRQMYLFRAVDSYGQTVDFYLSETRDREAAKRLCCILGNGSESDAATVIDIDQATSRRAPNTQPCPCRLCQAIPST